MKLKEWLINHRKLFVIWQIVAFAVWLIVFFVTQPWGDKLGVPASPQRITLFLIIDFWILKLPFTLFLASIVAQNDSWLAPRGRYVEGKKYPPFTTYTYTAIAFMAALFAVSGVFNFQLFDLPALPATISVSFFHPIIGFFTLWLGGVIRALVFGSGNPVQWFISIGLGDGATWIGLGVFYWWWRKTNWGKNVVGLFVGWSVVYWVWRLFYVMLTILWYVPANLYAPTMVSQITTFMPSSYFSSLAGLIIVEALIRVVERPKKALPTPTTRE
ncbi:MAG: hypothetical protein ACM3H7_02055 [Acidobacteriaceae bacterium]